MFNEGSKIIFRVALTLIKMNETELLRCSDFGDMAELFKQITRSSSVLDCHQFIEVRTLYLITNQSPTGAPPNVVDPAACANNRDERHVHAVC